MAVVAAKRATSWLADRQPAVRHSFFFLTGLHNIAKGTPVSQSALRLGSHPGDADITIRQIHSILLIFSRSRFAL